MYETTSKIEAGASYLSTLVYKIRHQVNIKLSEIKIINLVNEVIEECKILFDYQLHFIINSTIKHENIIGDIVKLKQVIKSLLTHAIQNNIEGNNNIINISLEDATLTFDIKVSEITTTKKSIEAIKLIIQDQGTQLTAEENNLQKLLETEDFDLWYIKIADRLHNMRTLHYIQSKEKRKRIALDTLKTFVPLARLAKIEWIQEELYTLATNTLKEV